MTSIMATVKTPRIVAGAIIALLMAGLWWPAQAADKTIAITYFVDHPAARDVVQGFKDALKAGGIEDGKGYRFDIQSAQGNQVIAAQIAKKFAGDRPDLIFAESTASSQALVNAIKDIPIVFAGVTDPVAGKLVANLERPGANVTGSKDSPPIASLLALIRECLPAARTIGVIYNAGEASAKSQVLQLRQLMKHSPFTLVEVTVAKASDVQSAAQSLVGKVEAIFLPNDSTVVSNFEVLNRVQQEARIPVFATDIANVGRGAYAGIGTSFYQGGQNAGHIAIAILQYGKAVGEIPVALPLTVETAVNLTTARALGMKPEAALLQRAKLFGSAK